MVDKDSRTNFEKLALLFTAFAVILLIFELHTSVIKLSVFVLILLVITTHKLHFEQLLWRREEKFSSVEELLSGIEENLSKLREVMEVLKETSGATNDERIKELESRVKKLEHEVEAMRKEVDLIEAFVQQQKVMTLTNL